MSHNFLKNISTKYCPRFGQLAVAMEFITEIQMMEAFRCQLMENLSGQGHRLLGQILMDLGWMTSEQIDEVLNLQMKRMREEAVDHPLNTHSGIS